MFRNVKSKFNQVRIFANLSIHRKLLNHYLEELLSDLEGLILDIGSKDRRYDIMMKKARKIIAIDIVPNPQFDVMGCDARFLCFKDEIFDVIVSFETMDHILETEIVLSEIKRVLKVNGTFIFSVPFIDPVKKEILRYTSEGWKIILEKFFKIEVIKTFGGRLPWMFEILLEPIRNRSKISFLGLPLMVLAYKLALNTINSPEADRYPMGYVIKCKRV